MSVADIEELAETGLGALVLAFGVLAGSTIYVSGSLGSVPVVLDRFVDALALALVPSASLAAWPSALALVTGTIAAVSLRDRLAVRACAFLGAYLFVAVVCYYAMG